MKKIFNNVLVAMTVLAASMMFASCDPKSDDPGPDTYSQFATLVAADDKGSTFAVENTTFGQTRTLTTTYKVNTDVVPVGQRLMISYQLMSGYTVEQSGPINMLGYMPVINGGVEVLSAEDAENFKTNSVQSPSMMVTGKYLNMMVVGRVRNAPKTFKLVADESTMGQKKPTIYLIFDSDDPATGRFASIYASFDISSIWNDRQYEGFIIKMDNETGENSFEFSNREEIKPVG